MDKYYYLVSQLPALEFEEESLGKKDYLLEQARQWMSPQDFSILESIDMNDLSLEDSDVDIEGDYKRFEIKLRKELAQWRKSMKIGHEEHRWMFPMSLVKEGTPLDVEKKLMRFRWDFISETEKEHFFDLEYLIFYFLKIQILERLNKFDKEKGKEIFTKTCEVNI